MPFHLHRHLGPGKVQVSYVLDVQSALLAPLATKVVIPVRRRADLAFKPSLQLNPVIVVGGDECVLITQQIAAMPARWLGEVVLDLNSQRHAIVAALAHLLSGI